MRAAEIAENLMRKELTPKERDAHTTIYVGLLKKNGSVVEGRKAQGRQRARTLLDPNGSGPIPRPRPSGAADLGVSDDTVRNRVRNATRMAARDDVKALWTTTRRPRHPAASMTARANQVAALADDVALLLAGVPPEKRSECAVRILADYRDALARQFPGTDAGQRQRFLIAFAALLERRQARLAKQGTA